MNSTAPRIRIRQVSTKSPTVRELDARQRATTGDRIVGCIGAAGVILLTLEIFFDQLIRELAK